MTALQEIRDAIFQPLWLFRNPNSPLVSGSTSSSGTSVVGSVLSDPLGVPSTIKSVSGDIKSEFKSVENIVIVVGVIFVLGAIIYGIKESGI